MQTKSGMPRIGIIGIALTTVIGSGVWKDSLTWSNSAGFFSIAAVFVGWLLMLTVGLSYAECVGMFPQGGGPYSYVGGAFGRKAGAFTGMLYLAAYIFIGSLLAFLTALFGLIALEIYTGLAVTTLNIVLLTALVVVVLGLLGGLTPVKHFGIVAFLWVVIKIVLVIGVFSLLFTNWTPNVVVPSLDGFQSALNNSIWALLGFDLMLVFSGELTEPEKKMPKTILLTLPIFLVVYLIVSLAASGAVAIGEIPSGSGSATLLGILASKTGVFAGLVFVFASFSAAGTAYAILAALGKQASILAADGYLPAFFGRDTRGLKLNAAVLGVVLVLIVSVLMTASLEVWG
ncbi:MAG: amino acid permease, partial [Candidatus Thorarchaeota archaeon]|nr:amino acid permease [Candidatus Thorarchaeota archaeon]